MTVGITDPTGSSISFVQVLYRIVQRRALLVALLVLATMLGADPWRTTLSCQPDAACIAAADDAPVATGNTLAVIELPEYLSLDDPVDSSDETVHDHALAAHAVHFAVRLALDSAAHIDRRRQILFPDKTGPPRA